jgi:hypothetical protein
MVSVKYYQFVRTQSIRHFKDRKINLINNGDLQHEYWLNYKKGLLCLTAFSLVHTPVTTIQFIYKFPGSFATRIRSQSLQRAHKEN